MVNYAPFFVVVRSPWLKTLSIFLKNSRSNACGNADASLFDDFIAACQRPLRRSIRVNTLKITVADFCSWSPLSLAAHAGSVVRRGFLDRA